MKKTEILICSEEGFGVHGGRAYVNMISTVVRKREKKGSENSQIQKPTV